LYPANSFKPVEAKAAVEIEGPVVCWTNKVEISPRTGSNKHTIHKIAGAPVAIWCARERIIGIEPVLTHRRRIVDTVGRTNMNTDRHLCLGMHSRQRHQNSQ